MSCIFSVLNCLVFSVALTLLVTPSVKSLRPWILQFHFPSPQAKPFRLLFFDSCTECRCDLRLSSVSSSLISLHILPAWLTPCWGLWLLSVYWWPPNSNLWLRPLLPTANKTFTDGYAIGTSNSNWTCKHWTHVSSSLLLLYNLSQRVAPLYTFWANPKPDSYHTISLTLALPTSLLVLSIHLWILSLFPPLQTHRHDPHSDLIIFYPGYCHNFLF